VQDTSNRRLSFSPHVEFIPEYFGTVTMSRLKPADSTPSEKPVDTEIPCFTLKSEDEPESVNLDRLRDLQEEDPDCQCLTHFLSSDSSVAVDAAGVLGKLLPSGEFQIHIPLTLHDSLPVTFVANPSEFYEEKGLSDREAALVLGRGILEILFAASLYLHVIILLQ
jgi:hypothetical protein